MTYNIIYNNNYITIMQINNQNENFSEFSELEVEEILDVLSRRLSEESVQKQQIINLDKDIENEEGESYKPIVTSGLGWGTVGGGAGSGVGALVGAAIGTYLFPGLGTAAGAKIGAILGGAVCGVGGAVVAVRTSANEELQKSQRKMNLINAKMLIKKRLRENGVKEDELKVLKGKIERQMNSLQIGLENTNELLRLTQVERDRLKIEKDKLEEEIKILKKENILLNYKLSSHSYQAQIQITPQRNN
jgi:uncharacterized membrane protein